VSGRSLALVLVAAAMLVGCGEETSPDVMLVTRTGAVPGARLSLRITDDGRASCNRRPLIEITSAQLIEARALSMALARAAKGHRVLAPGPESVFSYAVRLPQGTVRFSDDSRGQSKDMFQLAYLTRRIARGECHLAR
jgi:hypothetical protein